MSSLSSRFRENEFSVNPVARVLMMLGLILIAGGVFWQFVGRHLPLGRLPGDFVIDKPHMKVFFPLTTSIVVSVVLSLALWVVNKLKG